MADLIIFPSGEIANSGKGTLKKRRSGAIGRPRTSEPRRVVRVVLEPDEIKQIEAKPIALLPIPEHVKAIPPFERLSLAHRMQITYVKQQPKATRAVIEKRDRLVHTETVLGNWRCEIWRVGGIERSQFYFRTESLLLGAQGGQSRRSKSDFDTVHECLKFARLKAGERESLWRGKGRNVTALPIKKRRRRYGYIAPSPVDTRLIEKVTSCDCPTDEATCPICARTVQRNTYALRSHFRPHVQDGLLQSRQVDELLSFLVVSECSNNLVGEIITL